MTNTNLIIVMATIMVVGVLGTNLVSDADALKSKNGTSKSTDICGLELCYDYPGGKEAFDANWSNGFLSNSGTEVNVNSDDHSDSHSSSKILISSHNADQEFPAQLDAFIHKFELDKISADEALEGIEEVHDAYVNERITNGIIDGVGEKLNLYKKGTFDAATAVEAIHLTAEPQNVDPEYQGALDEVIHKFELDKISADEAMDGIEEAHYGFVDLYITSDLIEAVDNKIKLIDSGKLSGADAVEAIHLTAEPQNVDPEFILAIEEYTYQYDLNDISLPELIDGITEVYDGMIELTVTSDLIEDVGVQLVVYDSGRVSPEFTAEEIVEIIERAEFAAAKAMSDTGIPVMKELPPNTVDIPAGTGVPGCETDGWCYMSSKLTVSVGTTVTWINSDTLPHTATSGNEDADMVGLDVPNGFDSGFMSIDDRFEHTFDVAGLYDYYCQLHPWMIGSIVVE